MKYLMKVSYTETGMKGLIKEGGASRRTMVEKLAANLGGSLESFHFAFGEHDAYIIASFPNTVDVAAVGMTVAASGAARLETTLLLTPEEIDDASERAVEYRPPGA